MKRFAALLSLSILLSGLTLGSMASAIAYDPSEPSSEDMNAPFDYVYTETPDETEDVTNEAEDDDNETFNLFPEMGDEDQSIYFGMQAPFEEVVFQAEQDLYGSGEFTEWEYYSEDDGWKSFTPDHSTIHGKFFAIELGELDEWSSKTLEDNNLYWVRLSPSVEVTFELEIEQMGGLVHNVLLTVEDEDGDAVEDLDESDFDISGGSDNSIYHFRELNDGDYEFALSIKSSDTSYTIELDEDSVSTGTLTTDQKHLTLEMDGDSDDDDDNDNDDECETPLRDINNHWIQDEIEGDEDRNCVDGLYHREVVEGLSEHTFAPNQNITRAEFLAMILRNLEIDLDDYDHDGEPYRDVATSDWFYEVVVAARSLDIIDFDDEFRPNENINRAEAVTMLVRAEDLDLSDENTPFEDVSPSKWYADYVITAYEENLVEGYNDDTFRPGNLMSRAEGAQMVYNAEEELR